MFAVRCDAEMMSNARPGWLPPARQNRPEGSDPFADPHDLQLLSLQLYSLQAPSTHVVRTFGSFVCSTCVRSKKSESVSTIRRRAMGVFSQYLPCVMSVMHVQRRGEDKVSLLLQR